MQGGVLQSFWFIRRTFWAKKTLPRGLSLGLIDEAKILAAAQREFEEKRL
jgi:hypothetical protein